MSEPSHPNNTAADSPESDDGAQGQQRMRRLTNGIVVAVAILFLAHLIADRFVPSTDLGRVRAFVVPVTPQVSGVIDEILVTPNQPVARGELLARINAKDYELALEQARQNLRRAGQSLGVQTANVAAAQARVTNAEANLQNARVQSKRVFAMVDRGVMSQAEADNAEASLTSAEAALASAQADLAKAKERLGMEGEDNTQVRSALVALEQAQLNLSRTEILAPSNGVASNFRLKEGIYASAGQPLMTFISSDDVWIEAYFRENSLGNMQPGDRVEFALDYAPGRVFSGRLGGIDYGVNWGQQEQSGKLAQVSGETGWLRQTQRFPVSVVLDPEQARGLLRVGGQADVVVYTGDNALLNGLGWLWIRVTSWFSYVR
ncbi:HlyD family secretion protein [Ferrimonas sediminicola]|uniref:HlyD family secretion protein n=1 Tax=Ferrimonas sediminicola TaxID=2569538 RepID=A0A4U1B9V5_9GAMM|nr:HlyD family secretion protein [Ferrimonas sediminicola]TKB47336.1 HlyD family secretion protein [Ferrimonas sediminicola]